ncbi:hypothetical protein V5O48_012888 [Marasmius crinis-equi]|uniref:Uncharacterized protein n=1 Tax=Marasmius crinis-equi TaxID=585013 RepID=A0ABR3F1L2_9AGAR
MSTLMHTCTDNIAFVEFMVSSRAVPEWSRDLGQQILTTIVHHLPHATDFVICAMSTRQQFLLIQGAATHLTTLELHSPLFVSSRHVIPVIHLPALRSLHLFQPARHIYVQDFLARVSTRLVAPNLATLTVGNCIQGNGFALRELVRHFGGRLTKLVLLEDHNVHDENFTPLPLLPHLQQLEVDIHWAPVFIGHLVPGSTSASAFPSLHTIVLQATPESVAKGLPDCRWPKIWNGINAVSQRLKLVECCYRGDHCGLQDSFRIIVQEKLLAVAPYSPLRGPWTIWKGHRDSMPAPLAFVDDSDSAWGYTD